ncbi:hypothetical protein VULLAG_LOCUS4970 [Vulpes lagopus]
MAWAANVHCRSVVCRTLVPTSRQLEVCGRQTLGRRLEFPGLTFLARRRGGPFLPAVQKSTQAGQQLSLCPQMESRCSERETDLASQAPDQEDLFPPNSRAEDFRPLCLFEISFLKTSREK